MITVPVQSKILGSDSETRVFGCPRAQRSRIGDDVLSAPSNRVLCLLLTRRIGHQGIEASCTAVKARTGTASYQKELESQPSTTRPAVKHSMGSQASQITRTSPAASSPDFVHAWTGLWEPDCGVEWRPWAGWALGCIPAPGAVGVRWPEAGRQGIRNERTETTSRSGGVTFP